MTVRKNLAFAAIAAAAILMPMRQASAVLLTSTQTVPFSQQLTDWNRSFSFDLFDSTLGTLTKVVATSAYGATSTLSITNNALTSSNGTANMKSTLTLVSGVTAINTALASIFTNVIFGGDVGYTLPNGGFLSASSDALENDKVKTLTTGLSPFAVSGGGTTSLLATTFTQTQLSNNGGNTSATQVTDAVGFFTIEYTYDFTPPPETPVPEPMSLALLGTGLLGLTGLMRRRKA